MADLVRLQKYMADQGVASRRACEKYIADGLVSVNGVVVTEMGTKVDPDKDVVMMDDQKIAKAKADLMYVMLYKPRGYETTLSSSNENARIVSDLLEAWGERLVPVGRLDKDSEGLLIMTNDGQLVHELTHPSFQHEKEYEVMVEGQLQPGGKPLAIDDRLLKRLSGGVVIDGRKTRPCIVTAKRAGGKDGRTLLSFTLKEGRNRQIRKMCEVVGLDVKRLKRVRVGGVTLKGLRPSESRQLSKGEVLSLKD